MHATEYLNMRKLFAKIQIKPVVRKPQRLLEGTGETAKYIQDVISDGVHRIFR